MEKRKMERQYGKRMLSKLVKEYLEAKANKEWLKGNTMACAGCEAHVEKTMGESVTGTSATAG